MIDLTMINMGYLEICSLYVLIIAMAIYG